MTYPNLSNCNDAAVVTTWLKALQKGPASDYNNPQFPIDIDACLYDGIASNQQAEPKLNALFIQLRIDVSNNQPAIKADLANLINALNIAVKPHKKAG